MQTIVGCDTEGFGRARLTWNGDGLGWAAFVHRFVGSCAGWGMRTAALGWAAPGQAGVWVRGFVGRSRVRVGELPESDERRVLV